MGCRLPDSDFDWIVYDVESEVREAICDFVATHASFRRSLPFSIEHASTKYRNISEMPVSAALAMLTRKRGFFVYQGFQFSLAFVCTQLTEVKYVCPGELGEIAVVHGVVDECDEVISMPRRLTIRDESGTRHLVVSWLFLYGGAFRTGDLVVVKGRILSIGKEKCIWVESYDSYIQLVDFIPSPGGPG